MIAKLIFMNIHQANRDRAHEVKETWISILIFSFIKRLVAYLFIIID